VDLVPTGNANGRVLEAAHDEEREEMELKEMTLEQLREARPDLVEALGAAGVRLLGIDGPSLDPQDAKDLVSHKALGRWRMAVLEGLVFDDVPDGTYELIAPPLRLSGADASPVRALLRDL
jgi:arylformamidase